MRTDGPKSRCHYREPPGERDARNGTRRRHSHRCYCRRAKSSVPILKRLGDRESMRLVEERELTEDVAGAEFPERRFMAVFGNAENAHVPRFYKIERVSEIALVKITWLGG